MPSAVGSTKAHMVSPASNPSAFSMTRRFDFALICGLREDYFQTREAIAEQVPVLGNGYAQRVHHVVHRHPPLGCLDRGYGRRVLDGRGYHNVAGTCVASVLHLGHAVRRGGAAERLGYGVGHEVVVISLGHPLYAAGEHSRGIARREVAQRERRGLDDHASGIVARPQRYLVADTPPYRPAVVHDPCTRILRQGQTQHRLDRRPVGLRTVLCGADARDARRQRQGHDQYCDQRSVHRYILIYL